MMTNRLSAALYSIGALPFGQLRIPNYQRPYRWKVENVLQLLQDIQENPGEYRIGSLILHHKGDCLDLVDGQQRVTTLVLILKELGDERWKEFQATYESAISAKAIRDNSITIRRWLDEHLSNDEKRAKFLEHVVSDCRVTVITVTDLAEAFQMFDSQNGHGKELLAYNLLKAFHIRAIDRSKKVVVTDLKIDYDRRWESAARHSRKGHEDEYIDLMSILTQRLYHIRLWARHLESSSFDKTKLKEFKGTDTEKLGEQSPTVFALAKAINEKLFPDTNSPATQDEALNLLRADMHLINGKAFFEYILKYVNMYSALFMKDPEPIQGLEAFYEDYQTFVDYPTGRSGDRYLKELFQSLVIAVYDKFGVQGVNLYYKTLYSLTYRLRLKNEQVRFVTVCRYPLDIFAVIESAYSLSDLNELVSLSAESIECRRFEEDIAKYILDNSNSSIFAGVSITDNGVERFRKDDAITTEKLSYSHGR